MKKFSSVVLACFLLIVSISAFAFSFNLKVLENNIGEIDSEIYLPDGKADAYSDYESFSFDDFRIWYYSLKENEIKNIKAMPYWREISREKYGELLDMLEMGGSFKAEENMQYKSGRYYFIYSNSEITYDITFGKIFICDFENGDYWCVSRVI